MAHLNSTTSWDAELVSLRDEIMAAEGVTCKQAADMALGSIGALAEFAAGWDQWADEVLGATYWTDPRDAELAATCDCYGLGIEQAACVEAGRCVQQQRTTTPQDRARAKAEWQLAQGIKLVRGRNCWLVPSGTRSGTVHRVEDSGECSCEAGLNAKPCWHVEAVRLVDVAPLLAA
jgi:hypothetical protein